MTETEAAAFDGAGVVVTGAGNGIGRAIASRFAKAGARVVVNDVDADAAARVAEEIAGIAAPGDAASSAGVAELITTARSYLGDVDVYCANAGVLRTGGPDTDEDIWSQAWEVNVMSHVRASRMLLPSWLQRGHGRFIVTASAAGLLTMLGCAPYAVSKHAAVAYAEWLAATYSHRGLAVHCICPQGVHTQLLEDAGTVGNLLRPQALQPEQVADSLWLGISENRFLILPHSEVSRHFTGRATHPDRWLKNMSKLQQHIESGEPQER